MPAVSSPTRSQFVSIVQANESLCREHWKLTLRLDAFPPTVPGQFVQVSCRDLEEDAVDACEVEWSGDRLPELRGMETSEPSALLRRPFSLAGRRDVAGGVELELIHRVVGVGTCWLSKLQGGDKVFLLGPLGNSFNLPQKNETAILVGGGVGIPPMLYLATALGGLDAIAFCGATSRDLLPLTIDASSVDKPIVEFARHGVRSVVTTDDGSFGFRGFVTAALEKYLDKHTQPCVIYTCGPEPMMKRVAEIALSRGIECQVAVERAMACGMGTCQSCVIRVREGDDWRYRLACTDGPIFRATELLW